MLSPERRCYRVPLARSCKSASQTTIMISTHIQATFLPDRPQPALFLWMPPVDPCPDNTAQDRAGRRSGVRNGQQVTVDHIVPAELRSLLQETTVAVTV